MIKNAYKSLMFRLLCFFSISKIKTKEKVIYLTFDDGPEPGITESIINILNQYDAKATFFCRADNFEKYPHLVQLIKEEGHSFGNHTYSHLNGLSEKNIKYMEDFNRGKEIIQSNLFRPPWGALSLYKYLKLRSTNKIILWNISSKDCNKNINWHMHSQTMVNQTKRGSIVLFHFCNKHAGNTMKILPLYLDNIYRMNYKTHSIKE